MSGNPQLKTKQFQIHSQIFLKKFKGQEKAPSSHELRLLKKEVKKRQEFLAQTSQVVERNLNELKSWLKGNDVKVKVKAGQHKLELSQEGTIKIQKQVDYSKVKVQSQIPFTTFQSFCDQYFRPLVVEDLVALQEEGDSSAYMIPACGKHYKQRFKEEDTRIKKLISEGIMPSQREYYEFDDTVYEGDVAMGPLGSRILSALVGEGIVPNIDDDDTDFAKILKRSKEELYSFEDRLREELFAIGVLDKPKDEGCEIRDELIKTQKELSEVAMENKRRKTKLLAVAEDYMAYQEYCQLKDEVNKAVESCYIKKFKKPKIVKPVVPKKKPENTKEINSTQVVLMNRKRLIEEVGNVYFPKEKYLCPTRSIYLED